VSLVAIDQKKNERRDGTFPPSSAVYEARFPPAMAPITRPVSVPPCIVTVGAYIRHLERVGKVEVELTVKSIFFTRRSTTNSFPTVLPSPGRMQSTPSGIPAFVARSPNSRRVRGVSLEEVWMISSLSRSTRRRRRKMKDEL